MGRQGVLRVGSWLVRQHEAILRESVFWKVEITGRASAESRAILQITGFARRIGMSTNRRPVTSRRSDTRRFNCSHGGLPSVGGHGARITARRRRSRRPPRRASGPLIPVRATIKVSRSAFREPGCENRWHGELEELRCAHTSKSQFGR